VYVADTFNSRIQKFNSSGNFLTKLGSFGSGNGQFIAPHGVALDSSGNLYVADTNNNRIQKFGSSGNFITTWGTTGSGDGQFSSPRGIAVDSSDNLYVTDTGNNRIEKFTLANPCPVGTTQIVVGVCFVLKWGTTGSDNGQFSSPRGIAVDSSSNVYVVDTSNHRIQKFSSSGSFLTQWGSFGTGNGKFASPAGIAVDSLSNVYVADALNSRIQKFDSSGKFITTFGSVGTGNGQFIIPEGVAVDSAGIIYIVDTGNNRVQKFQSEKITYTPNLNFVGKDSFKYIISDNFGATSSATVSVTVSDAPFIEGMVADDPKPITVPSYDNGDTITVRFSEPTNQPFKVQTNNQLTKADVDALFTFKEGGIPASLGANYTAEWIKRSTL
ncbi:MAG: 6-bladed beta-propeller, partial [Nitrososphaerales archaeon]